MLFTCEGLELLFNVEVTTMYPPVMFAFYFSIDMLKVLTCIG